MIARSNNYSHQREIIQGISSHYRSGANRLGKDFFLPCLNYCSEYRRAVGYFSSTALMAWLELLPRFAAERVTIYLLISPELSDGDRQALQKAQNESDRQQLRQISADRLVREVLKESYSPKTSVRLFAWMVANDRLILKFAFPENFHQPGIFHEKIGIFDFPWGDRVAFTGSANESERAYSSNYESIDVYRSWVAADEERVAIKQQQFEEAWWGNAIGLKVLPVSAESAALIRAKAPEEKPAIAPKNNKTVKEKSIAYGEVKTQRQWRHQNEAVAKFLEIRHGVLEMATGTGKTRTAIEALSVLDASNRIESIIISTDGTDLLDQWCKEIEPWAIAFWEEEPSMSVNP